MNERQVLVAVVKSHDNLLAGEMLVLWMDDRLAYLIVHGYFKLVEDPWQPTPASPSTSP